MSATPFPTSIAPEEVNPRPNYSVAQFDNPLSLSPEVQSLGGFRWEIDITMQKMSKQDAADFGAFIQSQAGGTGTFTFNLNPWVYGWDPAPGVRTFRLASNDTGWNAKVACEVGFKFSAIEDV